MTRRERLLLATVVLLFFGKFLIAQRPTATISGGATAAGVGVAQLQTADGATVVRSTPVMTTGVYTADYNSGYFTPKQTTDTLANRTVTSTLTLVSEIYCGNTTGSAATVTVSDGTSNVFSAVSVAANLYLGPIVWPVGQVMGNIVMSQGTTSSLVCYIGGYK